MLFLRKPFLLIFLLPVIRSFAQSGCTDYQATNYDHLAVINDGSCIYSNTFLLPTFKCYIDSTELYETSGILNLDNNFWTHVDNSNNSIYRIDTLSNSIFQKVTIANSTNNDWEDITSDSNYIYIGDIGNNGGNRTNLRFYKVLNSDITSSSVAVNAGRINFSYSDQVDFNLSPNYNFYDCEAFFCLNDSIHMFTKGWVNRWTKHYILPADTGIQIAQLVDSFYVDGFVTSAAIQGDSLVVLLVIKYFGANESFVWMLNNFDDTQFFSGNKRRCYAGKTYNIGQTEGICFTDTNKGYITNELYSRAQYYVPAQLHEFDLNPFLAPNPSVPIIATSVESIYQNLNACFDSGSTSFSIKNVSTAVGQNLYFSIGGLPTWLTVTPLTDTLAPGDSAIIILNFTSGMRSGGVYTRNLSIQSNDPYHLNQNIVVTLDIDSIPCLFFNSSIQTCTGITKFTSTSINIPTMYYWNFGDGNTSNAVSPSHTFASNGNYVTTLIGCNASGCDTVMNNIQIILADSMLTSCTPFTQTFCCGSGITNFQITGPAGDVFNNSSQNASVGYEDFTCLNSGTMITNYPYSLNCRTGTANPEYLKVWLDMNNDGIFNSVSEELFSDSNTVPPFHIGTITIPAISGNVYGLPIRMRVASDYLQVPLPCLNPAYGQHEDYKVILNFSVDVNEITTETSLSVYPNPFSHFSNINYTLKKSSKVRLEVFNMLGEKVSLLINSQLQPSGKYHFQFNEHLAGIYFVKLSVNDKTVVKKIVKTN